MSEVVKQIVGLENTIHNFEKRLDADDFADYLQEVLGCYLFVGTKNKDNPNTASPHHNGYYDLDEDSMMIAASCFVEYAKVFFEIESSK